MLKRMVLVEMSGYCLPTTVTEDLWDAGLLCLNLAPEINVIALVPTKVGAPGNDTDTKKKLNSGPVSIYNRETASDTGRCAILVYVITT